MRFVCNYFRNDAEGVYFVTDGHNRDVILEGLNSGRYLVGRPMRRMSPKTVDELIDQGVLGIYEPNFLERVMKVNPRQ
jgi:hypothetical protein